ncbi:MAG: hypothetical protein ACI9VR_005301, partial [Cognaticolwellia sp.]
MLLAITLFACSTEPVEAPLPQAKAPVPEAPAAPTGMALESGEIALVQLKNGTAEVPAVFATPKGTLNADGTGSFEIDLSSWNSALELRDTRVQELFFKAPENPTATFTLASAEGLKTDIAVGESSTTTLKGELSLYAGKTAVEIPATLTHNADGSFQLATTQPFQVSIESLGLNENLQVLMEVCAHESIGDAVDV